MLDTRLSLVEALIKPTYYFIESVDTFISRETAEGQSVIDGSNATIKSIAGASAVCTNLFDNDNIMYGYYITTSTGIITANPDWSISPIIPITANTTYTYTINWTMVDSTYRQCRIHFYDSNMTYLSYVENTNTNSHTFTTPATAAYMYVALRYIYDTITYTYTMTVNSGSTALPYEPYYSGIKSATATKITSDTGFKKIAVGDTINNFCLTVEQMTALNKLSAIPVRKVVFYDYTNDFYYYLYRYDTFVGFSKRYISTDIQIFNYQNLQADSYLFSFDSPVTVTLNLIPDYVQTNTGTSQTYPTDLTFPTSTFTIPTAITSLDGYGMGLSTTDNAYRNYIDFENKQFVQNQKKIRLTSALDWTKNTSIDINYFSLTLNDNLVLQSTASYLYLCNGFPNIELPSNATEDDIGCWSVFTGQFRFRNGDTNATTLDEWKAYLDANEIYLVYTLATPIVTDISAYITTDTYKVWANGTETFDCDVAPTLDSTYFVSRITEVN